MLGVLSERNAVEVQQSVGQIFMLEPRINEMEMLIDEQAVRLLRENRLAGCPVLARCARAGILTPSLARLNRNLLSFETPRRFE